MANPRDWQPGTVSSCFTLWGEGDARRKVHLGSECPQGVSLVEDWLPPAEGLWAQGAVVLSAGGCLTEAPVRGTEQACLRSETPLGHSLSPRWSSPQALRGCEKSWKKNKTQVQCLYSAPRSREPILFSGSEGFAIKPLKYVEDVLGLCSFGLTTLFSYYLIMAGISQKTVTFWLNST